MQLNRRQALTVTALFFQFGGLHHVRGANDPTRANGISIHMLPKRVADLSGRRWGFTVDKSAQLKGLDEGLTFQDVEGLMAFADKQTKSVQENGIWIVTTHPDAYSLPENQLLEQVKHECHRRGLTLFVARASELPGGWHRFD